MGGGAVARELMSSPVTIQIVYIYRLDYGETYSTMLTLTTMRLGGEVLLYT